MGKVINCECGKRIQAGDDDDLVRQVGEHVASDHPELAGKLTRSDILAMSEEQ